MQVVYTRFQKLFGSENKHIIHPVPFLFPSNWCHFFRVQKMYMIYFFNSRVCVNMCKHKRTL